MSSLLLRAALLAALLACGDASPRNTAGAPAATEAGLNLPEFTSPAWVAPPEIESIHDVIELANGAVMVSDLGEPAVFLVDSLGALVRRIGKKGSGPGEFLEPRRVTRYRADSLLLIDRRQGRYLVLDPTGGIVRTEALPPAAVPSSNTLVGDGLGNLLFPKSAFLFDSVAGESVPLRRAKVGSETIDSVASLRPVAVTRSVRKLPDGRPGSLVSAMVLYSPEDDWAVANDGAVALIRANPYRVEWLLPDGALVRGPTMSFDPIPVTAEDREGWEDSPIPPTKPPFVAQSSFTDPFGRVWVRHHASPGATTRRWTLFDRQGLVVTTVQFPEQLLPMHAGKRGVYVVRRDDDDLERLELYRWRQP